MLNIVRDSIEWAINQYSEHADILSVIPIAQKKTEGGYKVNLRVLVKNASDQQRLDTYTWDLAEGEELVRTEPEKKSSYNNV